MGAFRWICWWHDKHAWNAIAASCYKHQSGVGTWVIECHTLSYSTDKNQVCLQRQTGAILYSRGMWIVISGQLENRSISLNYNYLSADMWFIHVSVPSNSILCSVLQWCFKGVYLANSSLSQRGYSDGQLQCHRIEGRSRWLDEFHIFNTRNSAILLQTKPFNLCLTEAYSLEKGFSIAKLQILSMLLWVVPTSVCFLSDSLEPQWEKCYPYVTT